MKKLINLLYVILFCVCFVFSQNSNSDYASEANRNTAIRCLKLAESYYMNDDWENALKQAELGLSYDDHISDLIYIKSAAEVKLDKPKAHVIESMKMAFDKDDWVDYTQKGARILYADLLSDTGLYKESSKVLDAEPLLFSADAEFIRVKNLYRIGTRSSIIDARDKVDAAGRIYSKDYRFPSIFFMFEFMKLNQAERKGEHYTIPKSVRDIAKNYIGRLSDYDNVSLDTQIMSVFFGKDEDETERLIKAIDAENNSSNALLAYAGLKTGLYTEQQAFDLFFDSSDDFIYLGLLESLALNITEEGVRHRFIEKLLNYNGFIAIDNNHDLLPELVVKYDVGRPSIIKYDYNNDGIIDLDIDCDFGVPVLINFGINNMNVSYSEYPYVDEIYYNKESFSFKFFDGDYEITPVKLVSNDIFRDLGVDLFIPEAVRNINAPTFEQLRKDSTAIKLPIKERIDSYVIYTILEGNPIFADFYENDFRYAYADLSLGFPFTRHVDQDNNGVYETYEIFNIAENKYEYITDEENNFVDGIFSPFIFNDKNVYLNKIQIDRNSNTYFEFTETYLGLGGRITIWDNDDNGVPDSQYIKYPQHKGEELKEDSLFFDVKGEPYITINFVGGVPIKMDYKDSEVIVFAGRDNNFFWVDEESTPENEMYLMKNIVPGLVNGVTKVASIDDVRFFVIKINDKIFSKVIDKSLITE